MSRIAEVRSLDLASSYVHLGVGSEVAVIPVTDDFWPTIGERADLATGRLVTALDQSADWATWEMHPAGDEVIVQLTGSATYHLDDGVDVGSVALVAGQHLVVPTLTWHTAEVHDPGRILVITWGEGTRITERVPGARPPAP